MKPRILDLFCGAGGAATGYHRAGFEVVGVDIEPQPNYPFRFIRADAIDYAAGAVDWSWLDDIDVIHASPPCQAYSLARNNGSGANAPRLIEPLRPLLQATGLPYVIENVMGAPLENPVMICGTSLGLGASGMDLPRHRLFECNFSVMGVPCSRQHGLSLGVYGHGTNSWHREKLGRNLREAEKRGAMGIDWMTRAELAESIPPAYTEHIGSYLLTHLQHQARTAA